MKYALARLLELLALAALLWLAVQPPINEVIHAAEHPVTIVRFE